MNDYYRVRVQASPCTADITDLAAAFMADAGFESFEPDSEGLTAYISVKVGDGTSLATEALADFPMDTKFEISAEFVEGQDWNEEWEKHYFKPIVIEDRCVIHSTFHKDVPQAEYDIVIDPKMAFGTGHHQTTTLIIRHLLASELKGKSVTDVGTGTGILAILAAMRGATQVHAIEIDEFAHVNAVENVALNGHPEIDVILGDASSLAPLAPADILLANINRNIILNDLGRYADAVVAGGEIVLSGFYSADADVILADAGRYGLEYKSRASIDDWTCLVLSKS